jgi:ketosteroid isomerase-like protein
MGHGFVHPPDITTADMTTDGTLEVAERLFAAIVAGDIDALRNIYAPDAVIWHNSDGVEQSVDDNLRVLRWVVTHIANLRYEDVRRHVTPAGFVQQHVLRGTAPNGQPFNIPACLVCTVKDGRITRLEEYLDSAHITPLLAAPEL